MDNQFVKVFVYGTLLRGFRNTRFLEKEICLCEDVQTIDHGELLMFFNRPYIHFENKKYPIKGALFKIDRNKLNELDRLEKHPHWYRRVERRIFSKTLNKEMTAFVYEINDVPEVPFSKSSETGSYKEYMQNYNGECASLYEVINGKLIKND